MANFDPEVRSVRSRPPCPCLLFTPDRPLRSGNLPRAVPHVAALEVQADDNGGGVSERTGLRDDLMLIE